MVTGTLPLAALGLFPLPGGGAWLWGVAGPKLRRPLEFSFRPTPSRVT